MTDKIKLKSFQSLDKKGEDIDTQINNFLINDFNLLISDNAQGKTRLFNTLNFISTLFSGKPKIISTNFNAKIIFEVFNTKNKEEIIYGINIEPINGKNNYEEYVTRNNKTIFSSKDKILFNETKKRKIENYFIPQNVPALFSINDTEYVTINLIREYFQKIVYVSSEKGRIITVTPTSIIPDKTGTNIGSVLFNWSKNYPELFNEVVSELREFFPFIKKLYHLEKEILGGGIAEMLAFDEVNVPVPIEQQNWSAGVYRILWLIMSVKVPFNDNTEPPSLILVDEIENGLDFKSLKYIIKYYQEYSDDSQVVISSHSPLACDFIHPKDWIIAKRNGCQLNYISPKLVEDDIEGQLELFKNRHWDFYTKHISNSALYIVNE